jgi:hypothetical protein
MCNQDGEQSVDWCHAHRRMRADEEQDEKANEEQSPYE